MSWVQAKVMSVIHEYDKAKTGKWDKAEPPPENTFSKSELYIIGRSIVALFEGKMSDKLIGE